MGGHMQRFFSKTPYQNWCCPMGHPPLKNEAPPSEKHPPPSPIKCEAPFQEMITNTTNNNLKSNSNPSKMCEEVHF